MAELSVSRPFKHPQVLPTRSGLYVRDWRGTDIQPASERRLSVDLWLSLPARDPNGPGWWYVWPGWNDASRERLPWRAPTRSEKAEFLRENPGAGDAIKRNAGAKSKGKASPKTRPPLRDTPR